MAIIPVTLDNTFDQWRTKTNQLITQAEQIDATATAGFQRANVANSFAANVAAGANGYTNTVAASVNSYSNLVLSTARTFANGVGVSANSYSNAVGVSANSFSVAYAIVVGNSGNNYTISVGNAGNSYSQAVGAAGNSRAAAIGTAGNAYAQLVGAASNTNASNASYLSTGTVPSARISGLYSGITGTGAIGTGIWQGTPVAIEYGGTGANTRAAARTNLELGALAVQNSINGSQIVIGSDTQGDILYRGVSNWERLPTGTAGQVLKAGGAATNPSWDNSLTAMTAVNTTSGTSIDFTNIPSWARRVTILLSGVSTTGTSSLRVRLGTSSGFETTGYISTCYRYNSGAMTTDATAFAIQQAFAAAESAYGTITLVRLTGNIWVATSTIGDTSDGNMHFGCGNKTLSGALDRVRLTTIAGTPTFDAGQMNVIYE